MQSKSCRAAAYLGGSSFGETIGRVDIAWIPLLHRAALIEKHIGYDFFASFRKIKQWQKSVMALNLVKKFISEDFEEVFTNVDLSEKHGLAPETSLPDRYRRG